MQPFTFSEEIFQIACFHLVSRGSVPSASMVFLDNVTGAEDLIFRYKFSQLILPDFSSLSG